MYIDGDWSSYGVGSRNNTDDNEDVNDENESLPIGAYVMITIVAILFMKQNIYLIIAFRRRKFYDLNIFYCVVHWSFANILHSILPIYMAYVPKGYKNETLTSTFLAAHSIVSAFTWTIAVCFVFDKFINSQDFCRRLVRSAWLFVVVCLAVVLPLLCTNVLEESWIGYVYIAYSSIASIIFILRLFYSCATGNEEETFRLRVLMTGLFIISSYIFTGWWITNVIGSNIDLEVLTVSLFMITSNGFLNVMLMIWFQPPFRPIFHRLVGRCLVPCAKQPKYEDGEQPNINREVVNRNDA